jgi:hypothetical protein
MVEEKWTGSKHDKREMRTLNLRQVVRVCLPSSLPAL